ncbi:immunoglobulin superfamily member 3-like isoform X2 [Pristis pectinata]|nr:immunoglobulin superfamily member 3-like isoform X2 [Pristis pectinata]XP_051900523.1 immunoglobulin superfamily member 3-like isoform X2 [Pristis pectinata]
MAVFQWDLPDGGLYRVVPAGRVGGKASQRVSLRADLKSRSSRLTITRVSPEDNGRYVCIVQLLEPLPIVQMKGGGTHLRIVQESTPIPGSVSQSPASLSVREGETVNLTCTLRTTATKVEGMKFIWRWGTSSTTCSAVTSDSDWWQCAPVPDPGILVTTDLQTKSSEFRITRALLNYTGTFKCDVVITKPLATVILHGNGSVVLVEESPLTVSQFPSLLPVAEGEDARLTCVLQQAAADVRNLSFTWVTDRAEVSCPVAAPGWESNRCDGLDPRVSVAAHILNKSSILTIKEASVTDNGTYRCQVTLLDPPRNQTVSGDGSVVLVLESPLTVSQFPSLLPVVEGEDARLTCVLQQAAADVRKLSFTWVTDRAEVSCPVAAPGWESNRCDGLDPRVSVAAHILNKSSILTIKEASVTDNGTYRCQVTLLDPPRNQTVSGDGSVVLVLGDVNSPGTNESEDVPLLPVNTDSETRRRTMKPWFFISLLCVVSLTLAGGLGSSYWVTRRSGSGADARIVRERRSKIVHGSATSSVPVALRCWATWQDPRVPEGCGPVEGKLVADGPALSVV